MSFNQTLNSGVDFRTTGDKQTSKPRNVKIPKIKFNELNLKQYTEKKLKLSPKKQELSQ